MSASLYEREFFASYPARAIFSRWSASGKGRQNLKVHPQMARAADYRWEKDTLIIRGRHEDNGLPFEARLRIRAPGGEVVPHVELPPGRVTATASNSRKGSGPELACDWSSKTSWRSGKALKDKVRGWLQVDSGRIVDIDGIVLRFEHMRTVKYRIDVSEDGKKWKTVVDKSAEDQTTPYSYFKLEGRARHVKLLAFDWDKHWRNPLRVADFRAVARGEDPQARRGPYVEVKGADGVLFTLTAATGYRNRYPD
ncbi:MAG: discoidin domain-containing protein, partial [Planctomycetota bacterium]